MCDRVRHRNKFFFPIVHVALLAHFTIAFACLSYTKKMMPVLQARTLIETFMFKPVFWNNL